MRFDTIQEAAHAWVQGFNSYPQWMIEKLAGEGFECLYEITPPSKYDRVYVFSADEYGEIKSGYGEDKYKIKLDNGETHVYEKNDFEVQKDYVLPIWGTMWSFGESIDEEYYYGEYLGGDHLQEMADCGFRIFQYSDRDGNEEFFFGIDGAGYDFYESHWIPLYKSRGLKWHKNAA